MFAIEGACPEGRGRRVHFDFFSLVFAERESGRVKRGERVREERTFFSFFSFFFRAALLRSRTFEKTLTRRDTLKSGRRGKKALFEAGRGGWRQRP